MTVSYARLYVLMAREAPLGLIFRRGPSTWVQMILWDTKRDSFTPGQWLHGRIYPERCDLSPDGKLVVYFASKYNGKTVHENKFAWTAVSKPPYFTALDIHFQGDTWGGGGLFTARDKWITSISHNVLRDVVLENKPSLAQADADLPWLTIERARLYLDGWIVIAQTERAKTTGWVYLTWQKTVGHYTLTYSEKGSTKKAQYINCYMLKRDNHDAEISLASVPWADFDYKGRFVLAKEGKLFSATLHKTELKLTELADFNANKPEQIIAPYPAKKW